MLAKELPIVERIQPRFIEPMYAERSTRCRIGDAWSYEAKVSSGVIVCCYLGDCGSPSRSASRLRIS